MNDSLEHFGVKGMRWGQRKAQVSLPPPHPESSSAFDKTPVHQLSNKDLKTRLDRLNSEKNYNNYNQNSIRKGHNRAKEILTIGTTFAMIYSLKNSNLIKDGAKFAAKLLVKKVEITADHYVI